VGPGPRDPLGRTDGQQQLELGGEQLVVVVQVVAEEREGLDERPAAGHDLGAAVAEQVERRELLKDADRVVGAQDRHGAGQADAFRAARGRAEDDRRRRDREVRPVMLSDAEDVEAELVGELDLLQQVGEALLRCEGVGGELSERVDAELHALHCRSLLAQVPDVAAGRCVLPAPPSATAHPGPVAMKATRGVRSPGRGPRRRPEHDRGCAASGAGAARAVPAPTRSG
jgi:hypothetical protein